MKFNKNQTNNKRDVYITYFLAFCIYIIVGLLGGLSCLVLSEGQIIGNIK